MKMMFVVLISVAIMLGMIWSVMGTGADYADKVC